jgi:hypothetical protein
MINNAMRLHEVIEPKAIPTLQDPYSINYATMDSDELLQALNEDMGFVLKECSQIIQEYKKAEGVLFRGIRDKPVVCELPIRTDRRPMEMEDHFAKMLEATYETFGIVAHRQNSIFTSPMIEITETWGDTYIVFPKNGYKFSYFTELKNGQYAFDLLRGACSAALRGPKGEKITDTIEQSAAIMEVMEDLGITQTNLPYAIKNGCEVLIHGSSYYAFKQKHWGYALQRWLRI